MFLPILRVNFFSIDALQSLIMGHVPWAIGFGIALLIVTVVAALNGGKFLVWLLLGGFVGLVFLDNLTSGESILKLYALKTIKNPIILKEFFLGHLQFSSAYILAVFATASMASKTSSILPASSLA